MKLMDPTRSKSRKDLQNANHYPNSGYKRLRNSSHREKSADYFTKKTYGRLNRGLNDLERKVTHVSSSSANKFSKTELHASEEKGHFSKENYLRQITPKNKTPNSML